MTVTMSQVCPDPLDVVAHERAVADRWAGAVVTFTGVVRDHDGGRNVARLEYEAHPRADRFLAEVAGKVASEFGVRVAVSHRVGPLEIGDVALVAAVAGAHRAESFAACAALVEQVKAEVPVWKHQLFADGTSEWVGIS